MSKITYIKKDLEQLQQRRKDTEVSLRKIENSINDTRKEYALAYGDFFATKANTEFVLYERFPGLDAFEAYTRCVAPSHPLKDYEGFNIKELAEIIKHLYQGIRQENYQILTIGSSLPSAHEGIDPHLYFLIGNEKTLAPYQELNGKYFNDKTSLYYDFPDGKNLIQMEAECRYDQRSLIEVLTGDVSDVPRIVNFKDHTRGCFRSARFSLQKRIFDDCFNRKSFKTGKFKGVKDILSIGMHKDDTFIAKVLISIAIYKKNNGIKELTEQDYNHIFEVLFGHPINIQEEANEDIPRSLIYVPRDYEN